MMKKEKELLVAIASQKGGVGKSVFTVLLASVLHYRKDVRVAVVDCDSPQHSIALMRERDMENVMKNDDLKVNLYRQYERIRKPAYPVIKSDPEKGVEDLRRYMDEKGETFDIVLFDLPGTLRSEGVVHTVAAMDYIFVPLKADNIVMQSSLQFTKVLEEELIAKGNCNLKGIRLFVRVSFVPRCFHPIPVRRKTPAFLNWWKRLSSDVIRVSPCYKDCPPASSRCRLCG